MQLHPDMKNDIYYEENYDFENNEDNGRNTAYGDAQKNEKYLKTFRSAQRNKDIILIITDF